MTFAKLSKLELEELLSMYVAVLNIWSNTELGFYVLYLFCVYLYMLFHMGIYSVT